MTSSVLPASSSLRNAAISFAISRETAEAAIEVIEWFAEIRTGLYDLIQFGEEEEVILKIADMCAVRPQGITLRQAYRARLAGTDRKADNLKLLERLMDQCVLVRETDLEGVMLWAWEQIGLSRAPGAPAGTLTPVHWSTVNRCCTPAG